MLIRMRGSGMKWVEISDRNPGRSPTACRLRYQNYTEKKEWAEDEKDMLARMYHRFMEDMWKRIGNEMCRPWRSCERMHWQLGEEEMLRRANVQYRSTTGGVGATTMASTEPASFPASPNRDADSYHAYHEQHHHHHHHHRQTLEEDDDLDQERHQQHLHHHHHHAQAHHHQHQQH
ncbi:uncharacterized protein K452DRAFT_242298, partial [Aplosporella prunicola CBS 121167]